MPPTHKPVSVCTHGYSSWEWAWEAMPWQCSFPTPSNLDFYTEHRMILLLVPQRRMASCPRKPGVGWEEVGSKKRIKSRISSFQCFVALLLLCHSWGFPQVTGFVSKKCNSLSALLSPNYRSPASRKGYQATFHPNHRDQPVFAELKQIDVFTCRRVSQFQHEAGLFFFVLRTSQLFWTFYKTAASLSLTGILQVG